MVLNVDINFNAHTIPLKHAHSQMAVRSFNLSRLHWVFKTSSAACLTLLCVNTNVLVRHGAYSDYDCRSWLTSAAFTICFGTSAQKSVNQSLKDHILHIHTHQRNWTSTHLWIHLFWQWFIIISGVFLTRWFLLSIAVEGLLSVLSKKQSSWWLKVYRVVWVCIKMLYRRWKWRSWQYDNKKHFWNALLCPMFSEAVESLA